MWLLYTLLLHHTLASGTALVSEGDILGATFAPTVRFWKEGIVHYTFAPNLDLKLRSVFNSAIAHIEERTCARFVPRSQGFLDYVYVTDNGGCSSSVGVRGGKQILSLARSCAEVGKVGHELLHALGFYHEQARVDRDQYVSVNEENIREDKVHDFEKYSKIELELGLDYDYGSIMHYDLWAFSKNHHQTMTPLRNVQGIDIGQRDMLSTLDTAKVNTVYKCRIGNNCERRGVCLKGRCSGQDRLGLAQCKCFEGFYGNRCQHETVHCDPGRQHTCDSICLPLAKVCDGHSDCRDGSDEKQCGSCTFEAPCAWLPSPGGWLVHSGPTPSRHYRTGPASDHTTGSGHYLYIESSRPAKRGDEAVFKSPHLTPGPHTLSFYYHMYGSNIGQLKVMVDDGGLKRMLWQLEGEQGDEWRHVELEVSLDKAFRLEIVGVVGVGYRGDIAVDDVSVTEKEGPQRLVTGCSPQCDNGSSNGACLAGYCTEHVKDACLLQPCTKGHCVVRSKGERDCIQLDKMVTFEEAQQVWSNSGWLLHSGPTPTPNTGPTTDHTTGTQIGHYYYMKSAGRKSGQEALLQSVQFTESLSTCTLELWYYMRGGDVGRLAVYLSYGKEWSPLWVRSGPQGDRWTKVGIPLGERHFFRLGIAASAYWTYGDIAIDDLQLRDCFRTTELKVAPYQATVQAEEGSQVRLEIVVKEDIPDIGAHITWEYEGRVVRDQGSGVSLWAERQVLIINSLQHYGLYTCIVRYAGQDTRVHFKVLKPGEEIPTKAPPPPPHPHITLVSPQQLTIKEGKQLLIKLKVQGIPGYKPLTWFKIGLLGADKEVLSPPPPRRRLSTPNNRRTLRIDKCEKGDTGTYRLQIIYKDVEEYVDFVVEVEE